MYTKATSVTEYSGRVIDDKFLPVINPAMLSFKPEAQPMWDESKNNIIKFISGDLKVVKVTEENAIGIDNVQELYRFLDNALTHDNQFIALDSETTGLYPRDGYMIGFSISYEKDKGAYILTDIIDQQAENTRKFYKGT